MIQQIPLNGGLVTQVDGEEVSINACTELINAEFDKPGVIYKRKGSATGVDTNKTFISIFRWVNPFFTNGITWIALDSSGEIWHSAGTTADLTSWTTLTNLNVADARIYNHGSFLRVAGGTTVQPKIIQDINRSFFHNGTAFLLAVDELHKGGPPKYPTTFEIDTDATKTKLNLAGGGQLPFANTEKSCFYKFTPVFDGNQELPFSDNYHAFGIEEQDTPASNSNVQLRLKLNEVAGDFDPRITHINMYRAITDGMVPDNALYRKIDSFFLTESTVEHWITGNASTGRKVFSGNATIDGEVTSSDKLIWADSTTDRDETTINFIEGTGQKRDIATVYNKYLFLGADFDSSDHFGVPADSTKYWKILDGTNLTPNYGFEPPDNTDGFTSTSSASSTTRVHSGSNSLKCNIPVSSGGSFTSRDFTQDDYLSATSGDKYVFSFFCNYEQLNSAYDASVKVYVYVVIGGVETPLGDVVVVNRTLPLTGSVLSSTWTQIARTFTVTDDFKMKLKLENYGWNNSATNLYIDSIEIYKVHQEGTTVYSGRDVFAVNSSGVSGGAGVNKIARISGNDYIVTENIEDVFKVHTTNLAPSTSVASEPITSAGDQWSQGTGTIVYLDTYDTGLTDGIYHPIASTSSTEVNYKYSVITDGRNFVAGLRLDPRSLSGSTEDHDNWVIFSELNQYDILPISNYIQLRDLQGGAITGLSSLMGDLVVFMERGIYRLSVPSVDPTAWSLSESEENIGCVVDTSIASWESGVFFAGKDHLYFLDANFKAHPMTASIKDDYQGLVNESARTFYDVKKNRLLCRFGSDGATIYSLDLSSFPEERWTKVTSGSGDMDIFTVDENLALYSYDESTGGTYSQHIKLHDDSQSESTSFKRTTGWVSQADLDRSGVLRRLNLKYNSGDRIGVKIYIDGDDSTAVNWPDGNAYHLIPADTSGADWYKCKPSVRCRSYKIELYSADVSGAYISSTNDTEIRRIEVEFE